LLFSPNKLKVLLLLLIALLLLLSAALEAAFVKLLFEILAPPKSVVLLLSPPAAETDISEALACKFPNKDPEAGLIWSFGCSVCFEGS